MVVRAAQYVRMSTEHQKYSTANQMKEIESYAARHGFEIVRTYADEGKSGLSLDGRDAFKRLIDDVQNERTDFSVILVYDVTRWGRFQDADRSGYYEVICKEAGICVEFCAEQFRNDGSLGSSVLKSVKRIMAAEYSRELSKKVFIGQKNLIELGWRQGGSAGYALRRQLVDQDGNVKAVLKQGERKSLQTDRVVLIPGPPEEVATVRWMYRAFVKGGKVESEISTLLNARGVLTDFGRSWTRGTVHQVLINEKYIGNNVWNRSSFKLKEKHVRNGPDLWVRANRAFEPLIEQSQFDAAQAIIRARSRRLTDEEMLELLRRTLKGHGNLSGIIIDEAEDLPSSSAYQSRFGSLLRAYRLVGFTPHRDYRYIEINRTLRDMHPDIINETVAGIEAASGSVTTDAETDLLTINGEFTASVVIVRCRETSAGSLRWHVRLDTGLSPDVTVAVRMDRANRSRFDYYILPMLDMEFRRLRLAEHNGMALDCYRFETLEPLFELSARVSIAEVA
jgi:DNA invertase Pin-like site-specific DNA recombinase